jgi:hypothetical protein
MVVVCTACRTITKLHSARTSLAACDSRNKETVPLNCINELMFLLATGRVNSGSNPSTVALRDAGGDEKGTQCLGV